VPTLLRAAYFPLAGPADAVWPARCLFAPGAPW
jgi:hypothetical protein